MKRTLLAVALMGLLAVTVPAQTVPTTQATSSPWSFSTLYDFQANQPIAAATYTVRSLDLGNQWSLESFAFGGSSISSGSNGLVGGGGIALTKTWKSIKGQLGIGRAVYTTSQNHWVGLISASVPLGG